MSGDIRRHAAHAAELDNASLYVWPEGGEWAGMTVLKKEPRMIQFKAKDEQAAKKKAIRLAEGSEAEWKRVALISRW